MDNKKPNVLLLVSDQHNYKAAGYMGDEVVSTPNLDSLAKNGVVFEKTYCQSPVCTPSRASFLSGKYCHNNHCWQNHNVLFPEHKTIADEFNDLGYETCLVGKMHFGGKDQMHGFKHRPYGDFWHGVSHQPDPIEMFPHMGGVLHTYTSEIPESLQQEVVTSIEAASFIKEHSTSKSKKPWFVCASYAKPHAPLVAPKRFVEKYKNKVEYSGIDPKDTYAHDPAPSTQRHIYGLDNISQGQHKKAREHYYACVDFVDETIGLLLRELEKTGQLENTIIVYISDHGDLFGNHGLWWKANCYEEACRVPFIMCGPGIPKGLVNKELTGLIDLMPTLIELCGGVVKKDIDGVSLMPFLKNPGSCFRPHSSIITEYLAFTAIDAEIFKQQKNASAPSFRAIISENFKYAEIADVPGAANVFFDLNNDPNEYKNEIDNIKYASQINRMSAILNDPIGIEGYRTVVSDDFKRAEENYKSNIKPSMPNQYRLSDGRIFDAELELYNARWLNINQDGVAGFIPQKYF